MLDVDNIQRQDFSNFYHRYYFPVPPPEKRQLEIYGDFNPAGMNPSCVRFWFLKYTQPTVPPFPKVAICRRAGRIRCREDRSHADIFRYVGHLGGELADKDYPALEVPGQILGAASQHALPKLPHQARLVL